MMPFNGCRLRGHRIWSLPSLAVYLLFSMGYRSRPESLARKPGEAECCSEELAALVQHASLE
jgi:hypothetical protein